MKKNKIRSTAQVNLRMLADLGIEEAVKYQSAFAVENTLLDFMPKSAVACIAAVAEILYKAANERIREIDNHVILDLACGYGPRAFKMVPEGYRYIGGDLPGVINDIHDQLLKQEEFEEYSSLFQYIDVTDRERMEAAISDEIDRITVVTQGLLTYLDADQKHTLASGIHEILESNGGCWLIPDANPDRMLFDTFEAVMGSSFLVRGIYEIRDKLISRDASKINWNNCEEIVKGLQEEGFFVKVLPLWEEGMDMQVLKELKEEQQERLVNCWKNLNMICATLEE